MTTTKNPFANFSLGEEIQILPELSGGRITWNEKTLQVRVYFDKQVSPEDIKSQREEVLSLENELEKFKGLVDYDIEEYQDRLNKLKKAEFKLSSMLEKDQLWGICQMTSLEDVEAFKEHGMNCKKRTVGSFVFATGWRSKDASLEDLEKFPLPKVNYYWYSI